MKGKIMKKPWKKLTKNKLHKKKIQRNNRKSEKNASKMSKLW